MLGLHLQIFPVNYAQKFFFLRPGGCRCTHCTSWLCLWHRTWCTHTCTILHVTYQLPSSLVLQLNVTYFTAPHSSYCHTQLGIGIIIVAVIRIPTVFRLSSKLVILEMTTVWWWRRHPWSLHSVQVASRICTGSWHDLVGIWHAST